MDESISLFQSIRHDLETRQDLSLQLQQLAGLIGTTRSNEGFLQSLSNSTEIWKFLRDIIQYSTSIDAHIGELQARVIRGLIVLSRNLITNNQAHLEDFNFLLLRYLQKLAIEEQISTAVKLNTLHSSLEYFANFTHIKLKFETGLIANLNDTVSSFEITQDPECVVLLFTVFYNLIKDDEVTSEALSQAKGKFILELLLQSFESIDFKSSSENNEELSSSDLLMVKISKKLITHESFLKFITVHNEPSLTSRYLKIAQVVITSFSKWDVFDLTVILSWTFEHLQTLSNQLQAHFKVQDLDKLSDESTILYSQLSTVLDIYTHLTIFEHTKKFIDSYHGIDLMISILSTLHTNIKPLKLKDSERSNYEIPDSHFPGCKSLLIEVLSQLTHGNHSVQEQIREKHGLEVILSCTNIDDNEPFIKERSIVCLRFLLLGNEGNQKFVAALEARQVLDKEVVDQVGYDVEIKDGKVELKKKDEFKDMERRVLQKDEWEASQNKKPKLEDVSEDH
ncbi:hypothetical protein WICPIJ_007771 [Wickerhamomyces pijperi]|uniref:Ataxin-10 homolog n=1 Tax=Wickerhamomyces pijperi TaxID=599730 RepID=A0A9P8PZL8_WICPI|nr:hypothetical protein WICPIJ_007771 [Wickerhamomyces pijperi]